MPRRVLRIERMKMKQRIEKMMLSGITNQDEMAAAFGITRVTVAAMMKEIEKDWAATDVREIDERRIYRIRQLENLATRALHSFDLSKKPVEIMGFITEPCNSCRGSGWRRLKDGGQEECQACEGSGKQQRETVQVKQSPGEPSFLKVAKECIVEASKLEGLHPHPVTSRQVLLAAKATGDGAIIEQVETLYFDAPADAIIRAKAALAELKAGIQNGTIKPKPQDRIIDARVEKSE